MTSGSNLWSASPTLTVWTCDRAELTGFGVLDVVDDVSALTVQNCRVKVSKSTNGHDEGHGASAPFDEAAIISWRTFVLEI
jgi:hypothetical protein